MAKFVLEVDLDGFDGDQVGKELGRVLRYWGGATTQVELAPGARQDIYDSAYRKVGFWEVSEHPQG
ncbi:hypothetical protein ACWKSP_08950 [Micromonosporaceae bacterium Da 78-11]